MRFPVSGFFTKIAPALAFSTGGKDDGSEPEPAHPPAGNRWLRTAFEHSDVPVVVTDLAGTCLEANLAAADMFGVPEGLLRKSRLPDLVNGTPDLTALTGVQPGAEASPLEHRFTLELGGPTPKQVDYAILPHPCPGRLLWIFDDFVDRRRREESRRRRETRLREGNQTLRAIIKASPEAIVAVDIQGRVRLWNPAAQRLFGWASKEVLGRALPTVTPDELAAILEDVAKGRAFSGQRVRRLRKDGTSLVVSLSRGPIRDSEGAIVGSIAMMADLSEQTRIEEQAFEAQKMEAIGRLASGIAHDFNNILSAITGFAGVIAQDTSPGNPHREEAAQILDAAERAERMTQHLLSFGRRPGKHRQVVDLGELLRGLVPLLGRLIGEHIQIEIATTGATVINADPSQVEQILLNLAVNARDAMTGGGRLILEAAELPAADAGSREAPQVRLSVRDTGTGMDDVTRARVFEPFFTTKPRGKGTGLGLSTVYGIVRQNRAQISVASEIGKGTHFEILFPRAQTDAPAASQAPRPPGLPGHETVLVVEDDDQVRELVVRILRGHGYQVLEAPNGEEAIEVARRHERIDLLLTDVVMPQMSGNELAQRLTRVRPGMCVLYMSGYTEEAIFSYGVSAELSLIGKPFATESLLSRVRSALDRIPPHPRIATGQSQ